MPVTSNGWEAFYQPLVNKIKDIFSSSKQNIINNAETNPAESLDLSQEDRSEIQTAYEQAVDDTIEKTVADIDDELDVETENLVPESQITLAKVVGGFFLLGVAKRAFDRLHGATIARQAEDDREEAQDNAVNIGNNEIETVSRNELGETYARSARDQQLARGVTSFRWVHSGAEHPRENHLSYDGRIFNWEDGPPDEDGWPGEAYNCGCYAVPVEDASARSTKGTVNMKKYFNLVSAGTSVDIYMSGPIGEYDLFNDEGVIFAEFRKLVNEIDPLKSIRIILNSPGGSVYDGIAIHQFIKEQAAKRKVMIEVHGMSASIASLILLSVTVENRFMTKESIVMIHDPWSCFCGGPSELENELDYLNKVKDSLAQSYVDNTLLDYDTAVKLMSDETYMTAEEAITYGFVSGYISQAEDENTFNKNKKDISSFVEKIKSCKAEKLEHGSLKNKLIEYTQHVNSKGIDTLTEKEKQSLEELQDQVKVLEAKLQARDEQLSELKAEKEEALVKAKEAEESLQAQEETLQEKIKAQFAEAKELIAKATKYGFDVEGDSPDSVMQAVLAKGGIKNPETFSGEQLGNLFNFVIDSRGQEENDHDEAFKGGKVPAKEEKLQRPVRNKAGV